MHPVTRAVLLLVLLFAAGCEVVRAPDLVQLTRISARSVTLGDLLELRGDGFPEGKVTRITFVGSLFRPGQSPVEDVEITIAGESRSGDAVVVRVDDHLMKSFCGHGAHTDHTTFRGEVRVSFARHSSTAPPVVGTLSGVVLDVIPAGVDRALLEARSREGRRVVEHLGMEVGSSPDPPGLAVQRVERGGLAQQAGVEPLDVLTEMDGLALQALPDMRPSPGTRFAELTVVKPGHRGAARLAIDVSALRPRSLGTLLPSFVLVFLAVGLIAFFAGPLRRVVDWMDHLAGRYPRRAAQERPWVAKTRPAWLVDLSDRMGPVLGATALSGYGTFLAASGAFAFLSAGGSLISDDQDLLALLTVAVAASGLGRLVAGGYASGGWSLRRGALACAGGLLPVLPLALAVVAAAVVFESISLHQIVDQQGSAPWRWAALQNPGLFLMSIPTLLAAAPKSVDRAHWPELGEVIDPETRPRTSLVVLVCEWTTLWVVAGLTACLFTGGWRTPVMSVALTAAGLGRGIAAIVVVAKMSALALVIVALRAVLRRCPMGPLGGLYFRAWLPVSGAGACLAVLWAEGAERYDLPVVGVAVALALVTVTLASFVVFRVLNANRAAHPAINPWL